MKRIGILAVALLLLAACTDEGPDPVPDPEPAPEASVSEPPTPAPSEDGIPIEESSRRIPVQVWFLSELRGEPVLRLHHVEIPATSAVGRAAIEQLLAGVPEDLEARDPKAWSAVPEETELLGLTIENGTATVDFNEGFGDTGLGSTYDGIQIDQVVWTLTQFPTVKRVDFLIDGEHPEYIGGHGIVIDKPQTRKGNQHYLPPIVVFTPYSGQELTSPFTMTGLSNVFEATVSYRIRDEAGKIIDEGFTTATCGTDCYGTFSQEIDVDAEGPVVLEVFESSAEDGRPLHMQRVPLILEASS